MAVPFASEVRRHFDAVAQQFGLSCVVSTEREVRYENDDVFLIVNFDNGRSYELGIEVGRRRPTKPERPFSLAEVLRLRGVADATAIDGIMVSDAARLHDALVRLAALTLQHASDFLMGNDFSFAQVAKLRERESDAYALERDLRVARAKSEAAWTSRDYQAVVKALEPLEQYLSPAEKKRLDYSRRHLAP
ncbi:MAG: hypothetical protein ABIG36_05800 [Pseudomonadota bacterium]